MTRLTGLIDPELLRSFVYIAESGSISKAANVVSRTPAAVSMQLKKLEEQLNHTLIHRSSKKMTLTEDGERLYLKGRQLLELNRELVKLFTPSAVRGRVRIGMPDYIGIHKLPAILSRFSDVYPDVEVDVVIGRSVNLKTLCDQQLDIAIFTERRDAQLPESATVLYTEPLVWAGKLGGSACRRVPIPVSIANIGCTWRELALEALELADLPYRIAYTSDATTGQEAAVVGDLAVAPLPVSILSNDVQALDKTVLPNIEAYAVCLVRKKDTDEAMDALATFIHQALDG